MTVAPIEFADFGNALLKGTQAAYYSQRTRGEREEAQRLRESEQYIEPAMQGDPSALARVTAANPRAAVAITQNLSRLSAVQQQRVVAAAEYTSQASNAVLQANPAERPAIYRQMLEIRRSQGHDVSRLPPEYTPALDGQLRFYRSQAIPILEQFKQEELARRRTMGGGAPRGGGLEPLPAPPPAARPGPGQGASLTPTGGPPNQFASAAPTSAPVPQPGMPPQGQPQGMPRAQLASAPVGGDPLMEGAGNETLQGDDGGPPTRGPAIPPGKQVIDVDPEQHGGKLRFFMPDERKGLPRRPAVHEGGFVQYTMPDGTDVFYKPRPPAPPKATERPTPPANMRWVPGKEGVEATYIIGSDADPAVQERKLRQQQNAKPPKPPMTPKEQADIRAARADAATIVGALEDFETAFKGVGTVDSIKSVAGMNTPLNTAYNNAALLAKGEQLYNLGVLNGPDLDIIRRTLPDPSTIRGAGTKPADAKAAVDKIIKLIQARLSAKEDQLGEPMTDVRAYSRKIRGAIPDEGAPDKGGGQKLSPEEAAKLPPGTKFIGLDGIERVRR